MNKTCFETCNFGRIPFRRLSTMSNIFNQISIDENRNLLSRRTNRIQIEMLEMKETEYSSHEMILLANCNRATSNVSCTLKNELDSFVLTTDSSGSINDIVLLSNCS